MRILMLTQKVDRADSVLGFTHGWIAALASHPQIEALDVLCLHGGERDLPENVEVYSAGKESGSGRGARAANYLRALGRLVPRADLIFSHMIPRTLISAAPWALTRGIPQVLWYTHRQISTELRLASLLAKRIVTASPESFQLATSKLRVIGHGIDLDQFRPGEQRGIDSRVIAVGRLSPIKGYEMLIEAVALVPEAQVEIVGGPTQESGPAYAEALQRRAGELRLGVRMNFAGDLPHRELPARLANAALSVNLCPTGGLDKAVIEAMACGLPVLVHNRTFLPLLGEEAALLYIDTLDPAAVATKLGALLALDPAERSALGARLRARVMDQYGLVGFVERLVEVFEEAL